MHYEYHIQKISVQYTREGYRLEEDYERSIQSFAARGWRFVQLIDLTELDPKNPRIDLLFEREKGGA